MFEEKLNTYADEGKHSFTMRDFLAVGFRQRRLIINTFLGIFSIGTIIAFLLPKKYEAQMKILVRHERAESVVSPEREAPVQWRGRTAIGSGIDQVQGPAYKGSGRMRPSEPRNGVLLEQARGKRRPESLAGSPQVGEGPHGTTHQAH
jgi:hypothetical protein